MRLRSYDVCIASTQARAEVENAHAVLVMSDQLAAVSSIQKSDATESHHAMRASCQIGRHLSQGVLYL